MMIDRLEFLRAIAFIKHVIPDEETSEKNALFVRYEEGKLIMVGGGQYATKKVPMVLANTIHEKDAPDTFMIPKGTLLSFEMLMKKHKKKAKRKSKESEEYLYVDVNHKQLESFDVVLTYPQPSFSFKHLEGLFDGKKGKVSEIQILSEEIENISKGFKKSEPVEISFVDDGKSLHFRQESNGYEAHLIQKDAEVKDDEE